MTQPLDPETSPDLAEEPVPALGLVTAARSRLAARFAHGVDEVLWQGRKLPMPDGEAITKVLHAAAQGSRPVRRRPRRRFDRLWSRPVGPRQARGRPPRRRSPVRNGLGPDRQHPGPVRRRHRPRPLPPPRGPPPATGRQRRPQPRRRHQPITKLSCTSGTNRGSNRSVGVRRQDAAERRLAQTRARPRGGFGPGGC